MVAHALRLAAARDVVDYICSRNEAQMATQVPNCPGWTVYNAAVHIGRVGVAWHSMIDATPDDPDSRVRGYADAESRGSGHSPTVVGSWAHAALQALDDEDLERPCYFSMTGGHGTVALWGWHAASELAVHRLDVESALGDPYALSDELAIDAIEYTTSYFLPAMIRATEEPLPQIDFVATTADRQTSFVVGEPMGADTNATVSGPPVELLLAIWGRPHKDLDISGTSVTFDAWHSLPGKAFQFGTWD